MTLSVNVISPTYGFGYQADLELVSSLLEQSGFQVTRTGLPDISKGPRLKTVTSTLARRLRRFDINIFLGGIFPEWLPLARRNVSVPNVEDIPDHNHKYLRYIDLFVAKTRLTEQTFRKLAYRVEYSGFTSRDHLRPDVPREHGKFFHACSNQFKGTKRLIELWARHPEWPELVTTINHHPDIPEELPPNIRALRGPRPLDEVIRIRNTYSFHICPSETEGFGHYIVEAMSCRAVVFATDGPPMNELIQPSRGMLIDILDQREPRGFSQAVFFKPESVEENVEKALGMGRVALEQLGENARAYFLETRQAFMARFPEIIRSVAV